MHINTAVYVRDMTELMAAMMRPLSNKIPAPPEYKFKNERRRITPGVHVRMVDYSCICTPEMIASGQVEILENKK